MEDDGTLIAKLLRYATTLENCWIGRVLQGPRRPARTARTLLLRC